LARTLERSADVANPLNYLGQLLLWEGDWDGASRYLNEALAVTEATGDRQLQEGTQGLLAELDILRGNPGAAIERLGSLVIREDGDLGVLLPTLAWAHLEMESEAHIRRGDQIAKRAVAYAGDQPGILAQALWVQGMASLRQCQYDEAEMPLTEGLSLARTLPFAYVEARILVQLAALCSRQGNSEAARNHLTGALDIFRRLGARKDIEQIDREIAELSVA
jgi:tetratricopeptide (TPR) repeat protein